MLIPSHSETLEETKRLARILELIQLIAMSPHRFKRPALAARFEVSVKTIGKDLEIIRNALKLEPIEALFPAEFTPLLREIASAPSGFYARRQESVQLLQYARANCYKVRMEYSTESREGRRSIRVIHPYDTYIGRCI